MVRLQTAPKRIPRLSPPHSKIEGESYPDLVFGLSVVIGLVVNIEKYKLFGIIYLCINLDNSHVHIYLHK